MQGGSAVRNREVRNEVGNLAVAPGSLPASPLGMTTMISIMSRKPTEDDHCCPSRMEPAPSAAAAMSMADYLVPTADTTPDIEIAHVETLEPSTRLGAKGIGEAGLIGAMGAVRVAVND